MDFKLHDVEAFLSQQSVGRADSFGQIFRGYIPANNCYGLKEMDVAIRVSHSRATDQEADLQMQFKVC